MSTQRAIATVAARRALLPASMKPVQARKGYWATPAVTSLQAARQRRASRLSQQTDSPFEPIYVKPLRELTHVSFKGHKRDRKRELFLEKVRDKMQLMPQKLKDYAMARQVRTVRDTPESRLMGMDLAIKDINASSGGKRKKKKKVSSKKGDDDE